MPKPERRVRLVAVQVQVEAVIDDGEHLTPVPIAPARIAGADFEKWATEGLPADLASLTEQLALVAPSD